MLIRSLFSSAKLFIIKGVKRKNPESKVEGNLQNSGRIFRDIMLDEVDPFDLAYVGPIKIE